MIGDAIALIQFLREHYDEFKVKSALFDWEGSRIEGDEELSVQRRPADRKDAWFYEVKGPADYVFVHMPILPGVFADYPLDSQGHPTTSAFRYVHTAMSSFASGGVANTKVSFIVYGYRPKDLLKKSAK